METALAIFKRDGNTTTGVTFDRETVEFKRLNDKVQVRRDAQAAAEAVRYRARQKKRDYEWFCTMSMGHLVIRALILVLAGIWTADGVLPVLVSAPVAIYAFCSALIRLGVWLEKSRHQK